MTQVAPDDTGNTALQAMRREAVYRSQIILASGRIITGDEAVAFTSMFANRTPDGDIDEDVGGFCDDTPAGKRKRLGDRATKFAKLAVPNRHWWERHRKR